VILFPYRAQIKLHKLPVVTIAVSVFCLVIYAAQYRNERGIEAHAKQVCAQLAAQSEAAAQGYRFGRWSITCEQAVLHIYFDPDPQKHLDWHTNDMIERGDAAGAERLRSQYLAFAEHAPNFLTARLWHDRSRFDPIGMLTSSFAHGSWDHVIFNLIFFFAFAAAVELILGPVLFIGTIVALSYGIGLFDSMISHWQGDPVPSLGLSGVVMGMLALFVYFLPRAKIRFFFWFMLSLGTIGISAWIVALWYVGWDLYYQLSGAGGYVNFVAHLAGAAFGFAIGSVFFRNKRHWARELVLESGTVDLTQEESGLAKLNAIMVAPAIAGFAFLAGLLLILLAILFVQRFWLLILMAAPALVAGYQIYRSRRADRPQRERYQLGMEAIERHEFQDALKYLEPLAQKNDTRALFTLANLYLRGSSSVIRDEAKAIDLYTRAAARGHAEAQYALAGIYAEGRGVSRDPAKAVDYYERAERAGLPDAANSLGYLYENGVGVPADREKAIEWYYRAGVGYQKAARLDDAQAVIRHLEGLTVKYPAVLGPVKKLKALVTAGKSQ
jgi:membrane associated rhomboid family serine protease